MTRLAAALAADTLHLTAQLLDFAADRLTRRVRAR